MGSGLCAGRRRCRKVRRMGTDADLGLATCVIIGSGMAIQAVVAPQTPPWGFYEQVAFVIVGLLWSVRGAVQLIRSL